eukprot:IDg11918t1
MSATDEVDNKSPPDTLFYHSVPATIEALNRNRDLPFAGINEDLSLSYMVQPELLSIRHCLFKSSRDGSTRTLLSANSITALRFPVGEPLNAFENYS